MRGPRKGEGCVALLTSPYEVSRAPQIVDNEAMLNRLGLRTKPAPSKKINVKKRESWRKNGKDKGYRLVMSPDTLAAKAAERASRRKQVSYVDYVLACNSEDKCSHDDSVPRRLRYEPALQHTTVMLRMRGWGVTQ